jgi:glutathione synthase/RimK-type ligase-like ATP-grasp enzyme
MELLIHACMQLNLPHYVFNQRNQENWKVELDYRDFNRSIISDDQHKFILADCSGIYLRPMDHRLVPEYQKSRRKKSIDATLSSFFKLMDLADSPRIINAPSPQMSNNSKPFQAMIICKAGLDIPETCITSNPEEAKKFIQKHGEVIYKSISGSRSIVKKVTESDLFKLDKLQYCPVQFQECVSGFNVRVHVIGQKAIATKICSDAVDYRYAAQESKYTSLEVFKLDAKTEKKCITLSHQLKLPFSGIDLMLADDGRTICFEVNPSPGYSYYEHNTGQPISYALAKYLQ